MYNGYIESEEKINSRWEDWKKRADEFDEQRRILANITEEAQVLFFEPVDEADEQAAEIAEIDEWLQSDNAAPLYGLGAQEPPQDYRIYNRRQADGTFPPLSKFFDDAVAKADAGKTAPRTPEFGSKEWFDSIPEIEF